MIAPNMTTTLKVCSMNVYGIPFIAKLAGERICALAEALESKDYDVICLQEVWQKSYYEMIQSKLESKMPHAYYFYSGLLGSGLCMFSKWPIVNTFYYKFPLNGYIHKINHGDWLAGKGVALAQIVAHNKAVNVFNVHLHAQYCEEQDEYLAHRLSQSYETGQLIRLMSESGALTILAGDCNSRSTDICMRLMCSLGELHDSFIHFENEQDYGTNETSRNSFTDPKALEIRASGSRIDYILFKSNSAHVAKSISYDFALPERIPGKNISYSDHEAIEATLELKEKSSRDLLTCTSQRDADFDEILRESYTICKNGSSKVSTDLMIWSIMFVLIPIFFYLLHDYLSPDHGVAAAVLLLLAFLSIMLLSLLITLSWIEKRSLLANEHSFLTLKNSYSIFQTEP